MRGRASEVTIAYGNRHAFGTDGGVAASEDTLDGGGFDRVGTDHLPHGAIIDIAAQLLRGRTRHPHARAREETRLRHAASIFENHGCAIFNASDPHGFDLHTARLEMVEFISIGRDQSVREQGHVAPICKQQGLMDGKWIDPENADTALIQLVTVAVGTNEDALAPAFGHALNVGKFVAYARRENDAASRMCRAVLINEIETVVLTGSLDDRTRLPPDGDHPAR